MNTRFILPVVILTALLVGCDKSKEPRDTALALITQHGGRYELDTSADPKTASVTTVNLGSSKTLTDEAVLGLGSLTQLRHLRLNSAPKTVRGTGLAVLAKMPELESLDLGHCYGLTEDVLSHVAGLAKLRSLQLHESGAVGKGAGLTHLKALGSLRVLNLAYSVSLEDTQLAPVAALTQLQELNLMRCAKLGDAAMSHLAALTSLEKLNLAGTRVTDSGLQHLHGLKKLQSLTLAGSHPTQQTVQCSDAAIAALQAAIPGIQIIR